MLSLLLFLAASAAPVAKCPPVTLAATGSKPFTKAFAPASAAMRKTSANFAEAYAKACAEGLMKKKPLAASGRLFLINAPVRQRRVDLFHRRPHGLRILVPHRRRKDPRPECGPNPRSDLLRDRRRFASRTE
jgi:hypothetical protein